MCIIVIATEWRRAVRISKEQTLKNRQKVVARASRLFRERGFERTSVNDLMKAAGFTHGGFYNHFASKDDLTREALDHAFHQLDGVRDQMPNLDDFVASYLSEDARDAPGSTCPAAALAGEVARQPDAVKAIFAEGLERMISSIVKLLPDKESARADATDIACRVVGALTLARAMPRSSGLGRELLETAKERSRRKPTKSRPKRGRAK
nr:TetR family transcriptional regulator [Bradyrhizobium elkanii]